MRNKILIFLTICVVSAISIRAVSSSSYFDIARNLDIFATLFREVNTYYVDQVDPEPLIKSGIDAMLESLDPYTTYIPEEEVEEYQTVATGQYAGIGALIAVIDEKVFISRLYEDFAAHRAGLRVGDEIVEIAGKKVSADNVDEIGTLLKGQVRTDVELKIRRAGKKELISTSLKREKITIGNVPYHGMVDEITGYIKLEDFAMGAAKEVRTSLEELRKNGAKSVILDLRGNPGGLLNEAINVSNLFIPKGVEVVSTKGKIKEWNTTYKSLNQPFDTTLPLVVLIDENSASAAEIVAGVIQDYDRGVLIGRRTFGKGLVQTTRELSYNAQLKVTTAKYYIPSGRCIQAIDYAHRNKDGQAETIADSLRGSFKTKAGRTVYDGSGLLPDISVPERMYSALAVALSNRGLVFTYANEYRAKNDSLTKPKDFTLSEAEYSEFRKWLSDKDYSYSTPLERSLDNFEHVGEKENFSKELSVSIKSIRNTIQEQKQRSLDQSREEITELLVPEIAGRYFLYKGEIESSFKFDRDIAMARKILSDLPEYKRTLHH